jgi:hypothetical protein
MFPLSNRSMWGNMSTNNIDVFASTFVYLTMRLILIIRKHIIMYIYKYHDEFVRITIYNESMRFDINYIYKLKNMMVSYNFVKLKSSNHKLSGLIWVNIVLVHILVKSKYVLNIWLKDIKWDSFNYMLIQIIIKVIWFLEPEDLMENHVWTFNKCSHLEHNLKEFVFFRFVLSWSKVQQGRSTPSVYRKNCGLSKYSRVLVTSTSIHTTDKSRNVGVIQIQKYVERHASFLYFVRRYIAVNNGCL